ncbi:MAG: tetratricopeptide repeat protein [Bacteroidota bacterium]
MRIGKIYITIIFLLISINFRAQKSEIYTNKYVPYDHAIELYQNKDYYAAQIKFDEIKDQFEDASELKARSYYYRAFCAIRLGEKEGEDLMREFVDKFPTSTKRNNAFLEVGDYYFKNANYPYALKWYSRVNINSLSIYQQEYFQFKFAYGLFAAGSYAKSKKYFSQLLSSEKYGAEAKYYYGYMAYKDDDYEKADKYLSEVANDKALGKDIPYFMANIKFKTGKFQEAIDAGLPLLGKTNGIQKSELSKIIGESYFNLEEYEKAIPYLMNYKGKNGKWNNTDYYQLGYTYYRQDDYQNAMEWFTKIIDGKNSVSQNAYYHLAECYLKSDKKTEALNAFKNASQMEFDQTIKQDAWLNYAKLSYEIGNPYQSTADIIQEYLQKYPTDINKDELNNLLISSFISAKDYEGAIRYLENKKDTENYQKVAFLRGVQLFNDQNYTEAKKYFNLTTNIINNYNAKATFWKAESDYRLNNFDAALLGFESFSNLADAKNQIEFDDIDYYLGYTYFKLKDYNKAGGYFKQYIESNPANSDQKIDAYMRLGDSFFALSNYYKALNPYEKVISANDINVDQAQYQSALCYGFLGENDKKINELENFLKYNVKSPLRDDALYELGNTYISKNETGKAIKTYDNIINNYPQSSYVPKALLKQGLIYYNTDNNQKALAKYKTVVKDYPKSSEANEAVSNARQIYVDIGKVDEYEKLINDLDYDVSDKEIGNTMFESAEKQYLNNNYKKAIEDFQKYLKRFPNGTYTLSANYYLADAFEKDKQPQKAIVHYKYIIDKNRNDYTENSLLNLSQIYLNKEDWENALPLLIKLEKEADSQQNIIFAQSNLMKGNYALNNYEKAVNYAEMILQKEKIEDQVKSDAQIIIARSAFKTDDIYKAQEAFKVVENSASGKLKAEAIYYDALFKHQDGDYKNSNLVIQKLASEFAIYRYWGSKGLIIMAKNFYELKDAYQATYILENVLKNFSDFPEVTNEAMIELQKIKKEEAKTNESVIQEN